MIVSHEFESQAILFNMASHGGMDTFTSSENRSDSIIIWGFVGELGYFVKQRLVFHPLDGGDKKMIKKRQNSDVHSSLQW